MWHQDQPFLLVINPQTLEQVIAWLLAPEVFASLPGRRLATWQPRMLAAAAVGGGDVGAEHGARGL
jgi:hypothetical protein